MPKPLLFIHDATREPHTSLDDLINSENLLLLKQVKNEFILKLRKSMLSKLIVMFVLFN